MAFWIEAASSLPSPSGLILAQTVVRFGIPRAESNPAIRQFALASRSAGRMPPPSLVGDAIARLLCAAPAGADNCRQHDQHREGKKKGGSHWRPLYENPVGSAALTA